jgi:hypothetical protein
MFDPLSRYETEMPSAWREWIEDIERAPSSARSLIEARRAQIDIALASTQVATAQYTADREQDRDRQREVNERARFRLARIAAKNQAWHVAVATWVLAGSTVILAGATICLIFATLAA